MRQTIEMFRGDSPTFTFAVEKDGIAVNITGGTFKFTVKENLKDADEDAKISKATGGSGITITDAANGKLSVSIATGDTSDLESETTLWEYDLQITLGGEVATVATGAFLIKPDVTLS